MNNKQWLNRVLALCCLMTTDVSADQYTQHRYYQSGALSWWDQQNNLAPQYAPQPWNQQYNSPFQAAIPTVSPYGNPPPSYPRGVNYQPASFNTPWKEKTTTLNKALKCENLKYMRHADRCIVRAGANLTGLKEQIRYLKNTRKRRKVAEHGGINVSNAALLETAQALLAHETNRPAGSFNKRFSMYEVGSKRRADSGHFTGYFTPEIQVQSYPDHEYRFPIYGKPPRGTKLTRRQIDNGALRGKGLEIAWTNDLVDLYFAQIQGSAIGRYPDGKTRFLNYAANNKQSSKKISYYIKKKNYVNGSLSNANVSRWLHKHPAKITEVLHQNPRYIFFSLSENSPLTATGTSILPGHTVAVDKRYIPLGSVLLAEIPRINHSGKKTGSDWKMLFAQDIGNAIKGPGRLDLYTGIGEAAERKTYQMTGLHKTYLLVRKP